MPASRLLNIQQGTGMSACCLGAGGMGSGQLWPAHVQDLCAGRTIPCCPGRWVRSCGGGCSWYTVMLEAQVGPPPPGCQNVYFSFKGPVAMTDQAVT